MALILNNPEAFAKHIERLVREQHMSYLHAILHFCERRQIEPEMIAPFITEKMKSELTREGLSLHLLKRSKIDNALPL